MKKQKNIAKCPQRIAKSVWSCLQLSWANEGLAAHRREPSDPIQVLIIIGRCSSPWFGDGLCIPRRDYRALHSHTINDGEVVVADLYTYMFPAQKPANGKAMLRVNFGTPPLFPHHPNWWFYRRERVEEEKGGLSRVSVCVWANEFRFASCSLHFLCS